MSADTLSPIDTPVTEQPAIMEQIPSMPAGSSPKEKFTRPNSLVLLILLILLFFVGGYIAFSITNNKSLFNLYLGTQANKIIFVREDVNDAADITTTDMWMMNPDGSQQKRINIPQLNPIPLQAVSSGWIFYTINRDTNYASSNIYAYNYLTNKSKTIINTGPDNYDINSSNYQVSPDGNTVVYEVTYLPSYCRIKHVQSCPDTDLYPDYKNGLYAYNINTDQKTYLGYIYQYNMGTLTTDQNVYTTQGWDYHEFALSNGFFKVDTNTAKATLVDRYNSSQDYVYYEYLLSNGEKILLENKKDSSGGTSQNGAVSIIKDSKSMSVDTTGNICNNSTCVQISPDERYALYTKADSNNNTTTVMLLDIASLQAKSIFVAQPGQSIFLPTWISSHEFIVQVDKGTYPDDTHNIVLVDVTTGKTKTLTTFNNARLY